MKLESSPRCLGGAVEAQGNPSQAWIFLLWSGRFPGKGYRLDRPSVPPKRTGHGARGPVWAPPPWAPATWHQARFHWVSVSSCGKWGQQIPSRELGRTNPRAALERGAACQDPWCHLAAQRLPLLKLRTLRKDPDASHHLGEHSALGPETIHKADVKGGGLGQQSRHAGD